MYSYQSHSPDIVERLGMVIWKIAVLVLGLRFLVVLTPQQGLLDGLVAGSSLLQGSALVLITAGIGWALIRSVRARGSWPMRSRIIGEPGSLGQHISKRYIYQALLRAESMQRLMWRGSNWLLALGLEALLAAQIIEVSMAYAKQNDLNWSRIGVVGIIALSRILF